MKKMLTKKVILGILILLVCILGGLTFLWIHTYIERYPSGIFTRENLREREEHSVQKDIAIEEVSPWMTFDYINHVFNLPEEYLKNNLNIQDTRYPRLTIVRYARENNLLSSTVNAQVQTILKQYMREER